MSTSGCTTNQRIWGGDIKTNGYVNSSGSCDKKKMFS